MSPRRSLVRGLRVALLVAAAAGAGAVAVRGGGFGEPSSNVHDLSATGPGAIHATSAAETQACVFCHTPHAASSQDELWNHEGTSAPFTPYTSTTLDPANAPGVPTGSSRLCLSCHDGTIAVGSTGSHGLVALTGTGAGGRMPLGPSNLGGGGATADLGDDHPVSFAPVPSAQLHNPPSGDPVKLDASGQLQCTSCHDPHNDARDPNPDGVKKFLVKNNQASAMCTTCHELPLWATAPNVHATSAATWNGTGPPPMHTGWRTVADNGCESCHRMHTAPGAQRLLKGQNPANAAERGEEWACTPCHNGNVAALNVQAEFSKPFVHPSYSVTPSVHDPTESPDNTAFTLPETSPAAPRHAECPDCHNAHGVKNAVAAAPAAPGAIRNVSGVTSTGAFVTSIGNEYELCFKCHAQSANKPQPNGSPYGPYRTRTITQFDLREELQTTNPSFHPVLGPRNSSEVPSLIAPWTASSVMYCVDCHNNDTGSNAGGAGPRGPHGSNYRRILERRLDPDGSTESAAAYALCYKCHSRTSILGNQSFGRHNLHVAGERASCMTCHDPHGVNGAQGNATNNAHLINFDTSVVTPLNGVLRYEDTGAFHGRCYLVCHGRSHNGLSY